MAYRDKTEKIVLRTRCGATREIEMMNPMDVVKIPLRRDYEPMSFIGDTDLDTLATEARSFEYRGCRDTENFGKRSFEYRGCRDTENFGKRIFEETGGSKTKGKRVVRREEEVARKEFRNTSMSVPNPPQMPDGIAMVQGMLPPGFELIHASVERNVWDHNVKMELELRVSDKSLIAAHQGYTSGVELSMSLRAENERLKADKDALRRERRAAKDKLGAVEYELKQMRKEKTAAQSRYEAEFSKREAAEAKDRSNEFFRGKPKVDPDRFVHELQRDAMPYTATGEALDRLARTHCGLERDVSAFGMEPDFDLRARCFEVLSVPKPPATQKPAGFPDVVIAFDPAMSSGVFKYGHKPITIGRSENPDDWHHLEDTAANARLERGDSPEAVSMVGKLPDYKPKDKLTILGPGYDT